MMKKIITAALALMLLFSCAVTASAWTADEANKADALYAINLFRGVSANEVNFELDKTLNRAEGIVMLIRMLGVETEATGTAWQHPFTDLSATGTAWADRYIGYAYTKGYTKGTNITRGTFSGSDSLTDQQFATMCLRALGYSDSGADADFAWNDSTSYAERIGVLENGSLNPSFDRGNAVQMIWSFLNGELKGDTKTLADTLSANSVFTADAFAKATKIANGESDDTSASSSSGRKSGGTRYSKTSSEEESDDDVIIETGDSTQKTEETKKEEEITTEESKNEETKTEEVAKEETEEPEKSTQTVTLPTTLDELNALTDVQKAELSKAIGEEEYFALIQKLQQASRQNAIEVGEDALNFDKIFG